MARRRSRSRPSFESCPPRYATRRRPERPTFGRRLAKLAQLYGQPFMPWQDYVAEVGCEIDPRTGGPAYREVIVTVPRQSGKTTLFLCWQTDRCLNWGRPQRSAFTAQRGKDARDKWRDELFPLIRSSKLAPLVRQIDEGMGNEAVYWRTGSMIRLLSTSKSAGHSKTLHQSVLDEIWHDEDDRREQGLRPAMITVPDAQLLVCSTAGTQASTVLNRKRTAGRLATIEDRGRGIAYFEWSAPDDWDPYDEASWWTFMPALGYTITVEALREEIGALPRGEVIRAYGNRTTPGTDNVWPPEVWGQVSVEGAKPTGQLRFGVAVAQDRSTAAIVATGGGVAELVEHRAGTGWVVARANELRRRHRAQVVLDFGGPAGALADSIPGCVRRQGPQVARACAALHDAVVDAEVQFRADPAFDDAVKGAVKKEIGGDLWVWSRKASTEDITPLEAATVAEPARAPRRRRSVSVHTT